MLLLLLLLLLLVLLAIIGLTMTFGHIRAAARVVSLSGRIRDLAFVATHAPAPALCSRRKGPAFCRLAAGSDDGGTKCLAHGSDGTSLKMLRVLFGVAELQSLQFGFLAA